MAKSSEEMDKMLRRTDSGKVLLALKLSQDGVNLDEWPEGNRVAKAVEVGPVVEKPKLPDPAYWPCVCELQAVSERLKPKVTQKDQTDKAFAKALNAYLILRQAIKQAIEKETAEPEVILGDIAKLEPRFRQGWEQFVQQRQLDQTKAAKSELAELTERERDADEQSKLEYKLAEKAGLFELEKQLTQKAAQLQILQNNLMTKNFTGKPGDYGKRISTAELEQTALEASLLKLEKLKASHDEAKRLHDELKQKLKDSQRRWDDLARQQVTQEQQLRDRADQLGERCLLIKKDGQLPGPLLIAVTEVQKAIGNSNFVGAQWSLDELQPLLEAEEQRLRMVFPQREEFLSKLETLEGQVDQIADNELASNKDQAALSRALNRLKELATSREYVQAIKQVGGLETLLLEVGQRMAQAQLAQEAFETALAEAQDDIEIYKSREIAQGELQDMDHMVELAESETDFAVALDYVEKTLKPRIKDYLKEQAKWTKVERVVRLPPKPPVPPNYGEAADRVVGDVLALFLSRFEYAGPSLDLSPLYPSGQYNPVRLKNALRARFNGLLPATALAARRLSKKCYFNLGAGGTTKKKYEYNVKVKMPGEDRARAQIHITYSS